ncbi:MAG: TonB-dependent receptor plug domain-containing protein, partial [Caldimicrobium sp.]
KDFGARNFYTFKFDTEFEETRTHLFLWKKLFQLRGFALEPSLLFRNNHDYYLLNRKNPDFYKNTHSTNLYRFNLPLSFEWKRHIFSFGLETSYEDLKSSRLGKYLRRNLSFYGGIKTELNERTFLTLQGRWDNNLKEKDFLSLGGGLAYLIKQDLKFRTSINYSYRLPSVTELRYWSIGIKGNPKLSSEKALNIELGLDHKGNFGEASFSLFYRKGEDLIDWMATSSGTIATNLNIKTLGGTFDLSIPIKEHKLFLSYTYLNQVGKNLDFASYYGNYLRHNLSMGCILRLPYSFYLKGLFNYQKRLNQRGVPILDLEIGKEFKRKFQGKAWIKNFFDQKYYELKWYGTEKGVEMPPFSVGLNIEAKI